ncbi:thioredoxin-like protein [Terfezia boudieri ATCC MYA-4762]|uniref:Thioredoxin-like protein n=1 Tax=Terfezia boudieri ATCC MYA-4762 TaxID=1051890 RepID=A0A3N4M8E0_9PEZI|nr:thioredoxin-like protein [Terfezia boudieri ATCC MYA-4762]
MQKAVVITSDSQLSTLISSNKTVVIDFHAQWCGPCKVVAPVYEKLSTALTSPGNIVFTKCDVDACQDVARKYNITAMPTFIIFKGGKEVRRIEDANVPDLALAVQSLVAEYKNYGGASSSASGSGSGAAPATGWWGAPPAKGYADISEEIEKVSLDIMNASTDAGTARTLFEESEPGKDPKARDWVESDTDEQLMIFVPFRSILKIHSIHLTSLPPSGDDNEEEVGRPRRLKLYANRPTIVGFEEAEGIVPTQEVEIAPESWSNTGTVVINTRFVKFQSIFSLIIFVEEGEDGCEKTRIDRIRVVGEAGEKRDLGKLEKIKDGHE